ncbi:hypothetical protein [Georgenia sp. MJ170]|uniref:hypothetical protein n=1 Tax=Georgenia sunbinii TaxID=3117728 RepID=UPI002F26B0FF
MSRDVRTRAVVACLFTMHVLRTVPASAVGAISPVESESVLDVAACTAETDHLLAAILVDESLTPRATDLDDLRVGEIETALDSLERLGANSDGALDESRWPSFHGQSFDLVTIHLKLEKRQLYRERSRRL